jgi:hypothetical protein
MTGLSKATSRTIFLRNHEAFVRPGMNMNCASNMMYLPIAPGIDANLDLGLHRGRTKEHILYNQES